MYDSRRLLARGAWLPLALLAAISCQQGPSAQERQALARLDSVSTERDQMLQQVSQDARTISEIAVELTKVRMPSNKLHVSTESPDAARRDSMVQKVRYIAARIASAESQLRQSQDKVKNLTSLSDSLRANLDSTIANFQTVVATQRTTIDSLVTYANQLAGENVALKDTVTNMATRENTVYYVIGTRQELIDRGIVTQEGGSRVLFVLWKTGQTLAPARELNPNDFTAINKREVTEIPLPEPGAQYLIASRQDPSYLATPPDPNGRIGNSDSLKIAAPEQFWANSKFLIIVRAS